MSNSATSSALDVPHALRHMRDYAGKALFRLRMQTGLNALALMLTGSAWLLVLCLLADKIFSLKTLGINVWLIWACMSLMCSPYLLWQIFSPSLHAQRAAVMADDRLGLHARISSALTLDFNHPLNRSFGSAFFDEALGKMSYTRVEQAFPIYLPRAFGWLLLPALFAGGIFYGVKDQDVLGIAAQAAHKRKAEAIQQNAAKVMAAKLEDLKEKVEKRGTENGGNFKVNQLLQKADKAAKEMKDGDADKDAALLKLGSLKSEIEQEKEKLERGKSFLDRLEKLQSKDLNLEDSDLTKNISEALKMGDPGQAAKEMRKLAQKLKDDVLNNPNLSSEQKEKELKKLQRELEKLAGALNDDKELSKDMYQISKHSMNAAEFEKLDSEIKKAEERKGKGPSKFGDDIQQAVEQAAEELERLQEDNDNKFDPEEEDEMDKLDKLEKSVDEGIESLTGEGLPSEDGIQQGQGKGEKQGGKSGKQGKSGKSQKSGSAKRNMSGKAGQGQEQGADKQGQGEKGQGQNGQDGDGENDNKNGQPGDGLGEGRGVGRRPYRDGDAEFEKQKLKGELRAGAITGISHFKGQGAKGDAPQEFVKALEAAEKESSSALDLERIPADARDMVKDYFSKVREGANLPQKTEVPVSDQLESKFPEPAGKGKLKE